MADEIDVNAFMADATSFGQFVRWMLASEQPFCWDMQELLHVERTDNPSAELIKCMGDRFRRPDIIVKSTMIASFLASTRR